MVETDMYVARWDPNALGSIGASQGSLSVPTSVPIGWITGRRLRKNATLEVETNLTFQELPCLFLRYQAIAGYGSSRPVWNLLRLGRKL